MPPIPIPLSVASLCLAVLASGAQAQPPKPANPPPVSQDVIVVAPKDAHVVSTYPANGGTAPGGTVIVKIVFDQPMTPEAWSYSRIDGAAFPDCLAKPRLLADRRTFVLLCSLAVSTSYGLAINAAPDFVSVGGRPPPPVTLGFKTSDAVGGALHEALLAAGLTDADDPIMGEAAAAGAVQSAPPPRP